MGQNACMSDADIAALCRKHNPTARPCFTPAPWLLAAFREASTPDAGSARAFEIADEAMYELLESSCGNVTGLGGPTTFSLCNFDCQHVRNLDDACKSIKSAFEWLRSRGQAELVTGGSSEFIRIIEPSA